MANEIESKGSKGRIARVLSVRVCTLVFTATVFCLWATADHNWEQSWKYRVRVETPLGSDKVLVLSWLREHCDARPYVDTHCEETLQGIAITVLAGVQASDVASFSRTTVRRSDLAARRRDHMKIYHFFNSDGKVVGHLSLPFREVAELERSNQMLAARQ